MSSAANSPLNRVLKLAIAALPCLLSMYTLYWLEYGGIWAPDAPHRGKSSVIILLIGMGVSFLLFSMLFKRKS